MPSAMCWPIRSRDGGLHAARQLGNSGPLAPRRIGLLLGHAIGRSPDDAIEQHAFGLFGILANVEQSRRIPADLAAARLLADFRPAAIGAETNRKRGRPERAAGPVRHR